MLRAAELLFRGSARTLALRTSAVASTAAITLYTSNVSLTEPAKGRLISATEREDLAANLSETISRFPPFLPAAIRDIVAGRAVDALVQALEEASLDETGKAAIQRAVQLGSSGADHEAVEKLTRAVCRHIDVPLLSEEA